MTQTFRFHATATRWTPLHGTEANTVWVDSEDELRRRLEQLRSTGWAIDGAWRVVMRNDEDRLREDYRQELSIRESTSTTPTFADGVAQAARACSAALVEDGLDPVEAERRTQQLLGRWLPAATEGSAA